MTSFQLWEKVAELRNDSSPPFCVSKTKKVSSAESQVQQTNCYLVDKDNTRKTPVALQNNHHSIGYKVKWFDHLG